AVGRPGRHARTARDLGQVHLAVVVGMRYVDLLENGLPLTERGGRERAARQGEDRPSETLRGEFHAGILTRRENGAAPVGPRAMRADRRKENAAGERRVAGRADRGGKTPRRWPGRAKRGPGFEGGRAPRTDRRKETADRSERTPRKEPRR